MLSENKKAQLKQIEKITDKSGKDLNFSGNELKHGFYAL